MTIDAPAVIGAGGVYVPGHLAEPVWRVLLADVHRRRADGVRVRPEVQQLLDALRAAALAHLSAHGHEPRTPVDIEAESSGPTCPVATTEALAVRLGVSKRHARRIARAEGIAPLGRDCWRREDVTALATRRERC